MFGNELGSTPSFENTIDTMDSLDASGLENIDTAETAEIPDISETTDTEQLLDALQLTDEEAEVYQSFDSLPIEGDVTGKIHSDSCLYTSCTYTTETIRCAYTK